MYKFYQCCVQLINVSWLITGKSTSLDPQPPRRFKRKSKWATGVGIAGSSSKSIFHITKNYLHFCNPSSIQKNYTFYCT